MKTRTATERSPSWHSERRWAIHQGGAQYDCALLYDGTTNVLVQVSSSGTALSEHRCTSRVAAVAVADELKAQYLGGGGLLIV
jgi:hypothetical protein